MFRAVFSPSRASRHQPFSEIDGFISCLAFAAFLLTPFFHSFQHPLPVSTVFVRTLPRFAELAPDLVQKTSSPLVCFTIAALVICHFLGVFTYCIFLWSPSSFFFSFPPLACSPSFPPLFCLVAFRNVALPVVRELVRHCHERAHVARSRLCALDFAPPFPVSGPHPLAFRLWLRLDGRRGSVSCTLHRPRRHRVRRLNCWDHV